jgi:hypothetical protein
MLLYAAVTLLVTWPLPLRLGDAVPSDLGDPLLNTWILWWNSRTVPLTQAWWDAPAFYPAPDVLAFSEHLLGLSPLTTPMIWGSGNPLLAYDVAFLLTFVLSAMGAYVLALTVTKRHDVAFVAGLAYGFAPYRMAQVAHIQVLASFWMPLALAALHRYVADRRARWLVLFGVATAFQGLTNGYYLFFFPVLVALWVLWFAPRNRVRATAGAVGAALAAATAPLVPLLLHYRAAHARYHLERASSEVSRFSAGIDDLLNASANLTVWGGWLGSREFETQLFPGLTGILVIAVATLWGPRTSGPDREARGLLPRPVRLALVVVATILSLVALSRLVLGPWRLELLGLTVSIATLSKPMTQAFVVWAAVVATGPFVRRLVRSRSPLAFYALAAVAMWALSLGPGPRFGDVEILRWGPYTWLSELPGFSSLRVPARFAMLAVLCLSTATALALARLRPRLSPRAGAVLVALASAGVLADGWSDVRFREAPQPSVLSPGDGPGAVLELPLQRPVHETRVMHRGIGHRHPVVNGYSGHEPPHAHVLRAALAARDPELLEELAAHGVRHVVVFRDRDQDRRWRLYVRSVPGFRRVRALGHQVLFELPARPPVGSPCDGPPLTIESLETDLLPERAHLALDGDPDTWWDTGQPQQPGDGLLVTLDAVREVSGLELALGPQYWGFPRRLSIEASVDGRDWAVLWTGPTGGRAFTAAVIAPRRVPLRVCFPAARARYLRLRLQAGEPVAGWAVAELVVLGRASGEVSVDLDESLEDGAKSGG